MRGRFFAQVRGRKVTWCASALSLAALGCGSQDTLYIGVQETDGALEPNSASANASGGDAGVEVPACAPPSAPPEELSADGFYTKYAPADGIAVLAPEQVDDQAVAEACSIVRQMLSARADVAEEMVSNGARVLIMDEDQQLSDLPGFEDLGPEWDDERGAGASPSFPLTGAAEENLLCLDSDVYQGEVLLVHSFAHAMRSLGIRPLEDDFDARLQGLYDSALSEGKWADTFAASSFPQYWAEGVQTWFGVNQEHDPPDGIHNQVNTPEELQQYDPGLYELLGEYLPKDLSVSCFSGSS